MKSILKISLLLFFISCKTNNNSEEKIDASIYKMWDSFISVNPKFKDEKLPQSWFFHNNKRDANHLANLIVGGKKKAGSGLYQWYKDAKADLPKVNTKHIITDFDGKAQAIIKVVKVDTIPFNKITSDYATKDMGTSLNPLKKWRKAHRNFFETSLKKNVKQFTDDMLVVCEYYEIIWTKNYK